MTESSGLGFRGFCHGIVVGDIDNDGDQDVFLCNFGPNALYLNNGDGTFRDISTAAGIDRPELVLRRRFLDYDNDGDLDLYVANYGEWVYPRTTSSAATGNKGVRLYCSPRSIRTGPAHPLPQQRRPDVHRRRPDAAGRRPQPTGTASASSTADLNGDGRIDIYVANDMSPNFLFLNKGDGTFEDATESSGAAYDEKGEAQSGMGVDAEDVNGDGLPELFVTNFANEYATLYLNLGKGLFLDARLASGWPPTPCRSSAGATPWPTSTTTAGPTTSSANGHVDDNRRELGQAVDYAEPPLLFLNLEGKRFRLATRDAGTYFDTKHVGRGAAFGDIDNDGDIDIVVNHKDGRPPLLRNDTKTVNHWIRLELRGTRATATPSAPASRSIAAAGRSIASARGVTAWSRPTTRGS